MPESPKPVPVWFRACCFEMKKAGRKRYAGAAYELCRHLPEILPEEEREEKLEDLCDILEGGKSRATYAAIEEWFMRELPEYMNLVPREYRSGFMRVVFGAKSLLDDARDA